MGVLTGRAARRRGAAPSRLLPMAFLSGSFIPLDAAPAWLRSVSLVFPLRYLNDGMLDVMVRGEGSLAALAPMAMLLGFALVIGLLTTRLFRW
ncbi:MAG: ABC transporter permease, partial [Actinomycetota bacterium]|nr:ABC transporter permease [Actinomycetota bacterium]